MSEDQSKSLANENNSESESNEIVLTIPTESKESNVSDDLGESKQSKDPKELNKSTDVKKSKKSKESKDSKDSKEVEDEKSDPESFVTAESKVHSSVPSEPGSVSLASSKLEDLLAAMKLNNQEDHLISVLSEYLSPLQNKNDSDDDSETSKKEPRLKSLDLQGVVQYMKSDRCRNVIVMVGAGISTSAGIPDFRSPNTGIYHKLARYNLPSPECMFEINYFKQNPKPFFELAKELFDYDRCRPTPCHTFIRLLKEKQLLTRLYTQNIDGLEYEAGLEEEMVIAAHGSFHNSRCLACFKEYDFEFIRSHIFDRPADDTNVHVPRCDCQVRPHNIIKPNIVFFGEQLPKAFFEMQSVDFPNCDLLLIIGTSLKVQPFAGLIDSVESHVPRVLINREKCGTSSRLQSLMGIKSGLEFNLPDNTRDVFLQGDCDDVCRELVTQLGWTDEFDKLLNSIQAKKPSKENKQ